MRHPIRLMKVCESRLLTITPTEATTHELRRDYSLYLEFYMAVFIILLQL